MIAHQHATPLKPERVVLLGARGFVSAAVKRQLQAQGVPTLALTSTDVNLADARAADALVTRLKPSDAVVMLAAITPDKGRDIATLMKNLAMMQSVCAALEKTGSTHFVYFSSDAVYDTAVSRVTESTPTSPQDLYGVMHYTREIMARNLNKVPLLILRPTLIYGLDDTHNSYGANRFRRTAQKDGKITLFGEGEETRDHIHVDDVAALTVRCLFRRTTGLLNVVTGTSISFLELSRLVAKQFNREIKIETTPRQNAVTHRHYDVTDVIKAFPDLRFVTPEDGVARVHRQMVEATPCQK